MKCVYLDDGHRVVLSYGSVYIAVQRDSNFGFWIKFYKCDHLSGSYQLVLPMVLPIM